LDAGLLQGVDFGMGAAYLQMGTGADDLAATHQYGAD
jgi:hypothetical protein